MTKEYAGRTAVITGAGSGLGAAMAGLFAQAGASVVLLDIDGPRAEEQAAALRAQGADAVALAVDVADRASLAAAATAVRERCGPVHVLCANVGVQQFGAIDALTGQDWQWVMGVNFHGVVQTVDAFLPLLRAAEGARHIVLTSSASFFQRGIRMAAYVASKYAVTGYGEVLRDELAGEGINVTLLFPAGMTTRHIESSIAARPADLGPSRFDPADVRAMMSEAKIDAAAHVASADHAVRNLLDDLREGARYVITHGDYRHQVEDHHGEVMQAFDRLAARP
ncbi:MAG TPA: SDR family oxidoreductase [Novosphingobium sp.]|nr:SDR family oxidoreductase [Novosphingobium sp.]